MCGKKLDDNACKNIIRDLGRRLNVDPKLIVTRLLSEDDKNDMRNGDLPINALKLHIELWIKTGCPDYAHGSSEPLTQVEGKDNDRQPENLKESIRDSKKEKLVTPAPLVPPTPHSQWEYRKPFKRPEDNQTPVSEEEPCLDPQTSSSESSPKEE